MSGVVLFQGGRMRLGMESHFFVEAKSFVFSVAKGKLELRLAERLKGFSRVAFLDPRCIAWLVAIVEEVCI
jgi:hypothetical protein